MGAFFSSQSESSEDNDASYSKPDFSFALSLLRETPIETPIAFSPTAIAVSLASLYAGAEGETKEEIRKALLPGCIVDSLLDHFTEIARDFGHCSIDGLRLSTGLLFRKDIVIKSDYEDDMKKRFKPYFDKFDPNDLDDAVEAVNVYVQTSTEGDISNLVDTRFFTDASAVAIATAHFDSLWTGSLTFREPQKETFYRNETEYKTVDMMHFTFYYNVKYAENERLQLAVFPFAKNAELAVFLPKERFGLQKIRPDLSGDELILLLNKAQLTYSWTAQAGIPVIDGAFDVDAQRLLAGVGVRSAFSPLADFSGISDAGDVSLTRFAHRTQISFNKQGAKTDTGAVNATPPPTPPPDSEASKSPESFLADHPFLYILLSKRVPVFIGQFV